MVRHVRVVPSAALAIDGAVALVPLLALNVVPTPPCALHCVADTPHQNVASEDGRLRETVTLLALAPTAPVQQYAADWVLTPGVCDARDVQVTEPPDAVGVTVVALIAFSIPARTTIRSPEVRLVNAAVVNDAGELP
jgi:hypothetical protein